MSKDGTAAVGKLLAVAWEAASFGASLRPAKDKLERKCRLFRRQRRAAAAVEFAAPVFFLLVFGVIEFGRMVMVQQVLTDASREGARVAVLDGATAATRVSDYLTAGSISGAMITVAPNPLSGAEFGDPVTVTASIGFNQVSWVPSPM